jgi:hypothetical protein
VIWQRASASCSPSRVRTLLLCALATAAAPAAAGPAAADVVSACAHTLPASAKGLAMLEAACPGLQQALTQLGVRPLLLESSRNNLRADSLPDLLALAGADQDVRRAPRLTTLGPILHALAPKPSPPSWWDLFRLWLQRVFGASAAPDSSHWLALWLAKLTPSQSVLNVLLGLLLLLVVAGAVVVVVRELRAAGVLSRRQRQRQHAPSLLPQTLSEPRTLAQVQSAPPAQQATLMFRLLVQTLVANQRLPDDRSLTHRELAGRARIDQAAQRQCWISVCSLAERQLLAATAPASADEGRILRDGEALYGALQAASGRSS